MTDWGDYTPGPWRVVDFTDEDYPGNGCWPFEVHMPASEDGPVDAHADSEADARLISKAYLIPRLEAALDELAVYQDSLVGVRTDARALLAELRSGL